MAIVFPPDRARLETVEAIRDAYVARRGGSADPILAQEFIPPGTDIVIAGKSEPQVGKTIAVQAATHIVQRSMPLGTDGA
jgi:hypothetical protein